jgi:hypothetical protein
MKTLLNRINQVAITTIAFACLLGTTVAQSGERVELHARFDIAPGQNWATVRLEAADWHLGSLQGTQATPAQLKALMAGSHLLAVGGRCAGWVDGQTSYPCGFAIEVLKLDSELLMAGPLHAYGWESTLQARERSIAQASPEVRASGLIAPLPDEAKFVGVTLLRVGTDKNPTESVLSFRIRALSNPLVPSIFDRTSGSVVLRNGPTVEAAPSD